MAKTIEITPSKAIRIEGINVEGKLMIHLRQMYKRKGDTDWKPGRNGLSIERDQADLVAAAILGQASKSESKFKVITRGKDE
jgi:hypothetical protein